MNIILIGMPGAGKSTVGVLLAKTLLCDFCDTDLVLQNVIKKSLCDFIRENGTEEFLRLEEETLCALTPENTVVATGGSAVYSEKAMKRLKENGVAVYLKVSSEEIEKRVSDITARGVVITHGGTITDIYKERKPLYEKYADVMVCCDNLSAEQCVEKAVEAINGFSAH